MRLDVAPKTRFETWSQRRVKAKHSNIHLRAQIDDQTVTVGLFDGIYPRLGDSIGKLVKCPPQQSCFVTAMQPHMWQGIKDIVTRYPGSRYPYKKCSGLEIRTAMTQLTEETNISTTMFNMPLGLRMLMTLLLCKKSRDSRANTNQGKTVRER